MWADVIMHRDTLRVYNNHMQSTQVNESDREYLSGTGLSADSLGDERLKDILRKLGRNFRVRAAQADSIAGIIHDGTPRVIVCGDFNDTPMSYTYRQLRGDLKDAFCEKGRGIIFTYRGLLGFSGSITCSIRTTWRPSDTIPSSRSGAIIIRCWSI